MLLLWGQLDDAVTAHACSKPASTRPARVQSLRAANFHVMNLSSITLWPWHADRMRALLVSSRRWPVLMFKRTVNLSPIGCAHLTP